ncbi:hypothetical protein [Dyadobacter aurulentus]|uniref:hypothetical protein n=1 Tax=Dyadobacter sp. UC 10 TaxID=2605428 RepID=UPI0011F10EDC|nr:hypothetical protein [Dyadobacter sp. UC 10]KAA0993267.1 hypothetical protein FXO21_25370 [Dyadobacter sp. UC 10]
MPKTGQNDFYGDQVVNYLGAVTVVVSNTLNVIGLALPLLYSLSRIFKWTLVTGFFEAIGKSWTPFQFIVFMASPFLLSALIRILPSLVGKIRKSWLYPSGSFTQEGIGRLIDRSSRKGRNGQRLHFLRIAHPQDQSGVQVEVDEETYFQLRDGQTLRVRYHPEKRDMLYLNVAEVNTIL